MSAEERKLASSPRTVAVVEDDPSMRRSIERLLGAYGYMTEGYGSAESFLAREHDSDLGCVVLDIHLGGMSGIQLRRALKEINFHLAVIFITAVDDEALEREAVEAGCVAYLHKPFPAASLIGAIEKAFADIGLN
jgi:FixJ family two-component response regulator